MNGWELSWWPELNIIVFNTHNCCAVCINFSKHSTARSRIPLYKKHTVYMVIYHTNSVGIYHGGWPLHTPTQWPHLPLHKYRGVVHYWRRQTPLTLFSFSFLTFIPNSLWSFTTQTYFCTHAHTHTFFSIFSEKSQKSDNNFPYRLKKPNYKIDIACS